MLFTAIVVDNLFSIWSNISNTARSQILTAPMEDFLFSEKKARRSKTTLEKQRSHEFQSSPDFPGVCQHQGAYMSIPEASYLAPDKAFGFQGQGYVFVHEHVLSRYVGSRLVFV